MMFSLSRLYQESPSGGSCSSSVKTEDLILPPPALESPLGPEPFKIRTIKQKKRAPFCQDLTISLTFESSQTLMSLNCPR